jgi:hypothetical protein
MVYPDPNSKPYVSDTRFASFIDRGYQPNWNVEVLNNRLPHSHGITALTCDQQWDLCDESPGPANPPGAYNGSAAFNGALNSVIAIRGNWLGNGQGISLHGTTSDVVAENNFIHNADGSFLKDPINLQPEHNDHVLLVNNHHDA